MGLILDSLRRSCRVMVLGLRGYSIYISHILESQRFTVVACGDGHITSSLSSSKNTALADIIWIGLRQEGPVQMANYITALRYRFEISEQLGTPEEDAVSYLLERAIGHLERRLELIRLGYDMAVMLEDSGQLAVQLVSPKSYALVQADLKGFADELALELSHHKPVALDAFKRLIGLEIELFNTMIIARAGLYEGVPEELALAVAKADTR